MWFEQVHVKAFGSGGSKVEVVEVVRLSGVTFKLTTGDRKSDCEVSVGVDSGYKTSSLHQK